IFFTNLTKGERRTDGAVFMLDVTGATKFFVSLDASGHWLSPRWVGSGEKGKFALAATTTLTHVFYDGEYLGDASRLIASDSSGDGLAFLADGFTPAESVKKALKEIEHFSVKEESKRTNRLYVLK